MKQTNTPYTGTLTAQQQADLLALLWGSMKRETGYDRVHTGWGQWGNGPYDASGCSSETWESKHAAEQAIKERTAA